MAVTLPTATASLLTEYAATSITVNRSMVPNENGHVVASFSASLQYIRQDYVVDGQGNKLNIVQRTVAPGMLGQDNYSGYISLAGDALAPLASAVPTKPLLEAIAEVADALIHADLVTRGVISA